MLGVRKVQTKKHTKSDSKIRGNFQQTYGFIFKIFDENDKREFLNLKTDFFDFSYYFV